MNISISLKYLRAYAKINKRVEDIVKRDLYWGQDDNRTEFKISDLELDELDHFHGFLNEIYNKANDRAIELKDKNGEKQTIERDECERIRGMMNACMQKVSVLRKVKSNPLTPIKDLESLTESLTEYIRQSPQKWVFKTSSDNRNMPYLVTSVDYVPRIDRSDTPAHVRVHLSYVYLDEIKSDSITYWYSDLYPESARIIDDGEIDGEADAKKKSKKKHKYDALNVQQLLDMKGYVLGVQELLDGYEKEFDIFIKYRDMVGEQFTSDSVGHEFDRWGRGGSVHLNTDGYAHKLVIDERPGERKIEATNTNKTGRFWGEGEESIMRTPIHMYVRMFNLRTHTKFAVHTSSLTPYVYDRKLIEKLVLPEEVKELVTILGKGAAEGLGDIIAGKAEGIIIGCVGAPGLGKTLTAEIHSEFLERPLYSVQCAQLGINPDELEKHLMEVLENAQRWRAVLLLDEADVYIRKRGHDIHQNAIVGVFLRVLEYYRGIIFMTTNLENTIDDAIESRFSAKIVFNYPDEAMAKAIWAIQMKNHGWSIKHDIIDAMHKEKPGLSGRGIRSLMKLSTLLARYRKEDISLDIMRHAAKFAVHEKSNVKIPEEGIK